MCRFCIEGRGVFLGPNFASCGYCTAGANCSCCPASAALGRAVHLGSTSWQHTAAMCTVAGRTVLWPSAIAHRILSMVYLHAVRTHWRAAPPSESPGAELDVLLPLCLLSVFCVHPAVAQHRLWANCGLLCQGHCCCLCQPHGCMATWQHKRHMQPETCNSSSQACRRPRRLRV
jgi:hypothetical protein